jgi:hypothetical protein
MLTKNHKNLPAITAGSSETPGASMTPSNQPGSELNVSPPSLSLAAMIVLVATAVAVGVCRTTDSSWPTVFSALLVGLVWLIRRLRHLQEPKSGGSQSP